MRIGLRKKGWMVLAVGAVLFVVLFLAFVDLASNRDVTLTAIYKVSIGVHNFYEANGYLPTNLDQLGIEARLRKDAWGHPIAYTVTSSNSWILRSLGPHGMLGKGNMAYSFDPSNIAGTLVP